MLEGFLQTAQTVEIPGLRIALRSGEMPVCSQ
jgi:hypothetical protein